MNFLKFLLPALLALFLAANAQAAEDASRFLLTPVLLQKLKSAENDLKRLKKAEEEDADSDDEQTIESLMKRIERDPATRAALAKHGLSSRDFALTAHAVLHAGMYVAMEQAMDKKKGAALFASYTKEQQANIAFMRTISPQQK